MSDNVKKTGIFGGAFDPVHNGHVRLAEEAVKQLKLRRLLIIPTYVSPHKHTDLAPFEDRAEMCRRAFGHIPGAEVSDIEVRLGGTSYTINTVRALKEIYPDEQLFLLIGGDMLFSFDKWYKYESLLKETKVCAAARESDSLADMMEYANELGRIKVFPTQVIEMSSTEVRKTAAQGGDISGMVPGGVAEYIREKGLYIN
ncbi:MAG: nicotinate (nicotinamide) nucleotide adenylyltransferase [Oscillospiraceae bacterium]|nr:nicotinate (nicotinamide) nucleotide adenylyltransferase [Oscillospiraceae bacterium]